MISEAVLVVLLAILIIAQLEYVFEISQLVHLDYLRSFVIITFIPLFLIALYYSYKILRISREQARFKHHEYITVQNYQATREQRTERQVQKLRSTPEYKAWQKNRKSDISSSNRNSGVLSLQQFQKQFGLVSS